VFKTVFAVSSGSYSDYSVLAVFEDEKTADVWAKAISDREDSYNTDARVERMTFVPSGAKPEIVTEFFQHVELPDGGEPQYGELRSLQSYGIDQYYGFPPTRPQVRYVRAPCHNNKGGRLEVRGNSERVVRKVVSERVAMWEAGSFGGPTVPEVIEEAETA
jgi:hypothetical protein